MSGAKARVPWAGAVTPWGDYLAAAPKDRHGDYRRLHAATFSGSKRVIERVVESTRSRVVACLGAGVLNDIPYASLVRSGATIHLVDWLPGVVEAGIALSIVETAADGDPSCAYCALGGDTARAFCRRFQAGGDSANGVCDNFVPGAGAPPTCAAFELGERPVLHQGDVTQGYASAFGEAVGEAIGGIESWRQALRLAAKLAKRVKHRRDSLSIPDHSVDLVTSSMLVSQFDFEPYSYFSRQVVACLGQPSPGEDRRLKPALERLRSTLVADQFERHCDEIERILAPGGRCFMSFEMFHYDADAGGWFLVRDMHRALETLAGRFDFDFDTIGERGSVIRFQGGGSSSVVHCYLLAPKRQPARAA